MVVPLAGYSTRRLLRASARTKVYEAVRKRDDRRVLAKVFELEDPSAEARVEHEFRLLEQLEAQGVVRALGIERAGHQLVLLLDFIDGRNLEQYAAGKPITVERFLPIASSLAATLAQVHAQRIVHRDIKPSNVLIESGSDAVYLADFGISVLIESERAHLYDPEVLEGTLPYISPEQTGRTTREVDVRSDLYSLGATFYELLTGRRPFEASEPLQLIHAHLARRPTPAHEVLPSIPKLLSAIVSKLLEKAPEDRYQSARGLHADLLRLAEALNAEHEIVFELGERDYADELRMPHRLYGRDDEQRTLEQEFARVGSEHRRAVVIVKGPAGVGKSALLRTLDQRESPSGGYVAAGRFEPTELPYRGIVLAFESLIAQLLTLGDEKLRRWRSRLAEALGPLAGVVAAMVPGLDLVLGELPPVPTLELAESRNRLHVALSRFLSAFASEGPLAIVLDDLQWADRSSLELLRVLFGESRESAVLLVAAYRSETPEADAPLEQLFEALEKAGRPITRLHLQPLASHQLEQLLADVLRRDRAALAGIVEWVARKTGGNPLYVRSFLLDIAARGLVRPGADGWEWDAEAIAEAPVPDGAMAIMRARLERLPPSPAKLLEVAACIGSRFDLAVLEAVAELPTDEFAAALHVLERDGLLGPGKANYVFFHDRIRDGALELLSSERRRALHWAIAQKLLQNSTVARERERLFDLLEHVDVGMPHPDMISPSLRRTLGRLHVAAGEHALASAAWTAARRYFEAATQLLEREDGRVALYSSVHEDASFTAAFGYAQALELTDDTDEADKWFEKLLTWQLTLVERSLVIGRRVRILQIKERMHDAYEYARAGLHALGVKLPARVSLFSTLVMVMRALFEVRKWPLERMLRVPEARDEREVAALYLYQAIKAPAYIVQAELGGYTAAAHALALMRAGHHPTAAECYSTMAFVLASLGNTETALQRCNDAATLGEQRESTLPSKLSPHMTRMVIGPLGRPHREIIDMIDSLHARALEYGERAVAGYIACMGVALHVEAGTHLREVLEIDARLRAHDESYGVREMAIIAEMNRRSILRLSGSSAEWMTEAELGTEGISIAAKMLMRATEIWGRFLLGETEQLWERAQLLRGYPRALIGSVIKTRVATMAAITCADHGFARGGLERRRALRSVRAHLSVAKRAAKNCRENFQPYVDVILGEIAALRGRESALRYFELARAAAFESGAYHVAGLASLRLSTWAGRVGLPVIEALALQFARTTFARWGAWAVVERLDRIELAVELDARASPSTSSASPRGSPTSADSGRALDVATLLGTMQAISEDLRLEEVITRVLESAIENAGADRGALLLARDDEWVLVAEGRDRVMHEFMREGVRLRDAADRLPCSVINYALRTGPVVIVDATADARFATDPYVRQQSVRSLLCMPIHKQSARVGVLVLENHLAAGAFTAARLEVLRALMGQAASALDNARLYAALSRSEAQWRSLVDGAPDMITQIDADGRIELINHSWPGHVASESIGEPGDRYMDVASRTAWRTALAAVVDTGLPRELELGYELDGHKRWTMTRLAAIQHADAKKVLSISTDITARKNLEAQVRQQQKLESIGTFASGVAHEINNPIQGILNYAELIAAQPDDVAIVREYSAEIGRESERVATIVRDLLAFSRRDTAQHVERIEVGALVAATLSLVSALLRHNDVRIELDVPTELPTVEGRPQQIRQILMNLITNARDATVARGAARSTGLRVITIRGRPIDREGATWVRLSVEDRGTGMSEEVRAQAFDPFFTTKGRDQGTGLGLAVSHGIAREHGGELSFETELGRGTTFHLDLPAVRVAASLPPK